MDEQYTIFCTMAIINVSPQNMQEILSAQLSNEQVRRLEKNAFY